LCVFFELVEPSAAKCNAAGKVTHLERGNGVEGGWERGVRGEGGREGGREGKRMKTRDSGEMGKRGMGRTIQPVRVCLCLVGTNREAKKGEEVGNTKICFFAPFLLGSTYARSGMPVL